MTVEVVYGPDVQGNADLVAAADPRMRQIAAALSRWVDQAKAVTNRSTLFDRGAYAAPDNIYEQMRIARKAVEDDDVVGSALELLEGFTLQQIKWESTEPDDADIFNQMAAEQNLDAVVRRMLRELLTYSQVVQGFWWDWGEFDVRGKTEKGNKRKKSYKVWYPRAITTLDSCKVVPVGLMSFGQEQLAWQATVGEIAQYAGVLDGSLSDELMLRFYRGQYIPYDTDELQQIVSLGADPQRLVLLDDRYVKRHTLTRPDHMRFAPVRMKRIFRLLDLKQQLLESDRVTLIGAANFILLVKKGEKDDPAYPEELSNLRENFNYLAKLPIIISDHRLNIEIIAPKTDFTLNQDKYDNLDHRIAASVLGLFGPVGSRSGNRGDKTSDEARLVARGMENARHMMKRHLELEIARAVVRHPRNKGLFSDTPSLTFVPRDIKLDTDTGVAQAIINLRTMNELSRESTLEYFGFDQAVEAIRREIEEKSGLDDTFQSQVPFSGQQPAATGGAPAKPPAKTAAKPAAPANGRSQRGAGAAPVRQAQSGTRGGRPVGGGQPSRNPTKVTAKPPVKGK